MKPKPLSVMRLIVPLVDICKSSGELAEIGRVTCEWVLVSSHTSRASRQQGRGPVPQRELCK